MTRTHFDTLKTFSVVNFYINFLELETCKAPFTDEEMNAHLQIQGPCLIRREEGFGKTHKINETIFNKSQLLKQNRAAT